MRFVVNSLLLVCIVAGSPASAAFSVDYDAVSSGGGSGSGGSYQIQDTIGQPVAGLGICPEALQWAGFWGGDMPDPGLAGTVADAKLQPDGAFLSTTGKVASAATGQLPGVLHVQEPERVSGIRVALAADCIGSVSLGDVVTVLGTTGTASNGERELRGSYVQVTGSVSGPVPLGISLKDALSLPFFFTTGGTVGQRGHTDPMAVNLSSIGLLVRVRGLVTDRSGGFLYVNDGTWPSYLPGARVEDTYVPPDIEIGDYIGVTGISSLRKAGSIYQMLIRPRQADDIEVLVPASP